MKIPAVLFIVACGAVPFIRLAAQDVTVGESLWALADVAPDELPKFKNPPRPHFPEEMRKTTEPGYALIAYYVDTEAAILSLQTFGSDAPFQRAVEAEMKDRKMIAAKRGGQAVNGASWTPVIFNPKSASVKGSDATPRLLAVTPVLTTSAPDLRGAPRVVRMQLALDTTGAIIRAEPAGNMSAGLLATIREALQHWRFAPARTAGQPVAAELAVSVICQPPLDLQGKTQVPPKIVKRELPSYPVSMRRNGMRGEVLVDFIVDQKGDVKNAVVARSNNPVFDAPALEAVRKWKFQPAMIAGRPGSTHMQVPIIFQLDNTPGGGSEAYHVETNSSQKKLPPELRYDTPAKIRGAVVPVYPSALLREGVQGRAKAIMQIDSAGKVVAVKVVSADRPEFGLALTAALENFTFDPAIKDGKPIMSFLNYDQEFNSRALPDDAADRLVALEKKHPEKILGADKVDGVPKPISRRTPLFPVQVAASVTSGDVLIEFLIDTDGHARLPRIVSASDPAFGYAAMQAIGSWVFSPPLAGGKPAVVRVHVPLNFKPD